MDLFDFNAEKALLGCVFYDCNAVETEEILTTLKPSDFTSMHHDAIFSAMQGLHAKGSTIDYVTIGQALSAAGTEKDAGGMQYVFELTGILSSNANWRNYYDIVRELSTKRKLLKYGEYIVGQIKKKGEAASAELINSFENLLSKIAMRDVKGELEHMSIANDTEYKRILRAAKGEYDAFGLATGFKMFDKTTWGLQPGNLIIIAARTSVGKTAFALNVLNHAAIENKKPCAFFSIEMSKEEIAQRLLGIGSGISNQIIKSGKGINDNRNDLDLAHDRVDAGNLFIDDITGLTVSEILIKAKKLKRKHGLDLIVIDYLQKITPARSLNNRAVEVGEITRGVKNIARQLKIPVIALAQLNRQAEKGKDGKKPQKAMLSDLRESGDIEQEADIVAFLDTDDPKEAEVKTVYLQMAKNRNGPMKEFRLRYTGNIFTFKEEGVRQFASKAPIKKPAAPEMEPVPLEEQNDLPF